MKPARCSCCRPLKWYVIDEWPGEGASPADCESWDCADCPCGRQYTLLPDGTLQIERDEPPEAA